MFQVLAAIKGVISAPVVGANRPPEVEAATTIAAASPQPPTSAVDPKRLKACIYAINTFGDFQTIYRDEPSQAAAFKRIRELKTPEEQQADDDRAYRDAMKAQDAIHAMGEIGGN